MNTPILIVGGGTGGVAAALAIAQAGQRCVITEPTDWVGGQLTAQAVPPDENRWIDGKEGVQSATRSYLDYRHRVRRWYHQHGNLTDHAKAITHLNPGNGWVSDLCHRPDVGHAVLLDMLAPHVASGLVTILLHHEPIAADTQGDRIRSVTFHDHAHNTRITIEAQYVLDATELGDVLALADVEHAIGAEHRDRYNEPNGRADHDDWRDQQAVSWCFALEHRPGEDHTIDKPTGYDDWAGYVPVMVDRPWTGTLFSWRIPDHEGTAGRVLAMTPWPDEPKDGQWELWRYRRIVDASYHTDASPDVSLVNWVQMDYWRKPVLHPTRATAFVNPQTQTPQAQLNAAGVDVDALEQAKHMSRCLVYWMQTQADRHDTTGQQGYAGLRLRGHELGTDHGFAKHPYIREARRLLANTIITEKHVTPHPHAPHADAERSEASGSPSQPQHTFPDSVGIGHYRLDLHPSPAGRNSIYVPTAPFQIPLGSLIPVRVSNLLAAGKCLGVTHVTNGCYRLHPIEWNIGESAGTLAAWCLAQHTTPHAVHADGVKLGDFQTALMQRGVALHWPWQAVARV